jgi:microcystin degradation protein MlrC
MRCGIIGLLQESNTFLPERTTLSDFANDVFARGEEVGERFEGAPHEIGGFLEGLRRESIQAVPIFAARALPYGTIEQSAFDHLLAQLFGALEAVGPLDGVLVAPHGATVSESAPDADGHWLGELRDRVGRRIPIVGTIDPHANLSPRMIAACDALIAYRTNPHVDQRQRGLEAAHLMARTLRQEARPTMAAAYPPLAISIDCQATDEPPCQELCEVADNIRGAPGVLSASMTLGFPYADVPEMGSAAIVVTQDDVELAERAAHTLATTMWERRRSLVADRIGVDDALCLASESAAPVCLLDMGDNIGGGSPGDGTWIAKQLLARRVRSLVVLCDAEAVKAAQHAGVGVRADLHVGGRSVMSGGPIAAELTVRGLYAGSFTELQPSHGGITHFDQGPSAVLTSESGLTILATSRRMAPFSLAQLTSCGLNPAAFQIIVAKGVNAPIAAYAKVCRAFFRVDTPGYTGADMTKLDYRCRRRPMFPFEPECEWAAARDTKASCPVIGK